MADRSVTLVACGAPLAARAHDIAAAIVHSGWQCTVVASPIGAQWVDAAAVEAVTGEPLSVQQRPIDTPRRAPLPDAVVGAPITFNTLNKIVAGISDTYAAGVLCEAISRRIPLVLAPTISVRLWNHPAVEQSLSALHRWGVHLLDPTGSTETPGPTTADAGDELVAQFDPQCVIDALRRAQTPTD